MDITRLNFAEQLPNVQNAISKASFIAIDCEFTGLSAGGKSCAYDTPGQRYDHLRRNAQDYLVVQFGLSAFRLDDEKQRYSQSTFNFYLFPRSGSQGSFLCQPSSLDFLVTNGFDFNRLIRDGIPFLRPAQLDVLRERLQLQLAEKLAERQPNSCEGGATVTPQPVPEDKAQFLEDAIAQIKQFVESSEEFLDFDGLTGFQRKLLYDHAGSSVTTPLELETLKLPGDRRRLRVSRQLSPSEREQQQKRKLEEKVDEAAGFSQVFSAISESGKPVVGHNMLLDLLHMVHQFVCPLPETYEEFKSVLTAVFPCLVDTKVMASTQPFRDQIISTGLAQLVESLTIHPFSMPSVVGEGEGTKYTVGDNKYHEAGYDAYLTGMCFASMVNYLGLLLAPPRPLLSPSADIVKPFTNKVFAFRMADMPYLNLTGDDVTPSRDHVFHISFPSHWKTNDLIQLFSPFSRVHVQWIDDTSAFVSLDRRDQASQVLQNVKATGLFTLSTYEQWEDANRKDNTAQPGGVPAAVTGQKTPTPSTEKPPRIAEDAKADVSVRTSRPPVKVSIAETSTGKMNKRKLSEGSPNGSTSKAGTVRVRKSSAKEVFEVPEW